MKKLLIFLDRPQTFNCFKPLYFENVKRKLFNIKFLILPTWIDEDNLTPAITISDSPSKINEALLIEAGIQDFENLANCSQKQIMKSVEVYNPDLILTTIKGHIEFPRFLGISSREFSEIFKVIYIPYYGATQIKEEEWQHLITDGNANYYGFIVDNPIFKQAIIDSGINGKNHIIDCGHPKIQEIYKIRQKPGVWPINNNGELKVIWAPHWSCPEFNSVDVTAGKWENTLKFGTFLKFHENFYQYAMEHTDIQFVFRPHPVLQQWLRLNRTHSEFSNFISKWNKLQNATTVLSGLYHDIFAASDVMITDGISFLVEYPIATEKPLIFIDNQVHAEFNEVGKLGEEYSIKVHDFTEIERLLTTKDFPRSKSADKLLDFLLPYRDNTSNMILNELIKLV